VEAEGTADGCSAAATLQAVADLHPTESREQLLSHIAQLATELRSDGQAYLSTLGSMQESNPRSFERLVANLSRAVSESGDIGAPSGLSAADERAVDALEIPATSLRGDNRLNLVLCVWLMATVLLLTRLGWSGVVYSALGLALAVVLMNFFSRSDYERNLRPPLAALLIRRQLEPSQVLAYIASTETPCPNLQGHVFDIENDTVLAVVSLLARWGADGQARDKECV
jgi:hypothetical protein